MRQAVALLFTLLLSLCAIFPAYAQVAVPALTKRVTDLTGTLAPDTVSRLESTLAQFEQGKGSQIAVLLIPTTQPEDIAQFGIRVAEQWKIGRKGVEDGIILIVAKNDRKVRIEVGYGLEGVIPDAVAKRIIEEEIVPRFKQGDFSGGVEAGVTRMMRLIEGEPLSPPQASQPAQGFNLDNLILPFMFGIAAGAFLGAIFGKGLGGFLAGLGAGAWVWSTMGIALLAGGMFFFIWLIVTSMGRGGGHWTSGGGGWGGGGGDWGG
ncbi:MAG: YgcG family protein, partial [Hydrogenophilaceae bacterium]|nr:YgcG family protein [Hydrogenophilaceae bacterium]